jgi:hypothetical protein
MRGFSFAQHRSLGVSRATSVVACGHEYVDQRLANQRESRESNIGNHAVAVVAMSVARYISAWTHLAAFIFALSQNGGASLTRCAGLTSSTSIRACQDWMELRSSESGTLAVREWLDGSRCPRSH